MRHVGGVEGGNVQDHWQMTDPHSGADRGQAESAQPVKWRHKHTGWPGKKFLPWPSNGTRPIRWQ